MRLEQQLGFSRDFGIQICYAYEDDMKFGGINSVRITPLRLESGERGLKLFEGEHKAPLVRLDYNADSNGSKPAKHLQYGKNDYFGESGNEAADIFAQIFVTTKRPLLFSATNEDDNQS